MTAARLRWDEPERLGADLHAALVGPGAPFELVDEDVLGTRLPLFAARSRSVAELIGRATARGDRAFLAGHDDSLTVPFADVEARAAGVAAVLASRGVVPGDRVMLVSRLSVPGLVAALGVMYAGAMAVPVNPQWTNDETTYARGVVSPVLVLDDDALDDVFRAGRDVEPAAPGAVAEDDPAAIIFTSGTTGRPKAAVLSHRNVVHFCLATAATSVVRALAHGESPGGGSGRPSASIGAAPIFHVSGLLGLLLNSLTWGTTVVVPPPGRWDPTTHLAITEKYGVTGWSLVPTQLWRLIEHPDLDRYDLSSLESVGGGGATFPPELVRATAARLPHVRTPVRIGYGMTETSAILTMRVPPFPDSELDSVGRAVAGAEIEVRDDAGRPLPEGEVGEIFGRCAGVFLGYWGDDAATARCLDADRWYATGDFGRIEGDVLVLESRRRDLIIRGGENVYPIEIENRLVEHPAIADAAVVGVPHRTLGQEVRAVVVARPGATIDADDVKAWVAATLVRYKVPTYVDVVDELPVNETGKVLKDQL